MHQGLGRPLQGTRVVDLSTLLPGPFATLLLADLGADVVKVERPAGGDGSRHYAPLVDGLGVIFASLNRNKRSLVLDLKQPEGRALLLDLIDTADVLVESFRPGVLGRLGLAPADLLARRERLVVCSLTGYGQQGHAAAQAGHDLNFIARAGLLHATGTPAGELALPGFQVADVAGGALYAVSAVLAALLQRAQSGRGCLLDVSITDGALSLLLPAVAALGAGATYHGPGRGLLTGGAPCYGVYGTADGGHVALAALEPKFWRRFCARTGFHCRLPHGLVLGPHGDTLRAGLQQLFRTRTRDEWIALLEDADCCCVGVRRPDELADDPLFLERDVFFALPGPQGTPLRQVTTPLTPADRSAFTPPPLLGEHSRALLAELGRPDGEVEALLSAGVTFAP